MALIEDFDEKAKQIIQNDSNNKNSDEDEAIEILEFDRNSKDDSNLETFVFDGEILIDNDPDGDICIDKSIYGTPLIVDDEGLNEGVIDGFISSDTKNDDEELTDYSNYDDFMA